MSWYLYIKGEAHEVKAKNINPYLVNTDDFVILQRTKPLCNVPAMCYGSKPVDDGNLIFTDDEKIEFLKNEPNAEKFFRPLISAKEFLNNEKRWCLWLINAEPHEIKKLPKVLERIGKVKMFRLNSSKLPTKEAANRPSVFAELRQSNSDYILIPRHSSENRKYIPIGFFKSEFIVSDSCISVPSSWYINLKNAHGMG